MKSSTGDKIRKLRISKGFSQDELSRQSGLSLRTIQRIENGETEPRGDSLLRLANAFDVKPEELFAQPAPIYKTVENEDYGYLNLLNLSALSFLIFPLLGIIVPLVLWTLKKDVKDIDIVAKRLINFQISWLISAILVIIILFNPHFIGLGHFPFGLPEMIMFVGIYGMYGINIIYIIFNTVMLLNKRNVQYWPSISFIKG